MTRDGRNRAKNEHVFVYRTGAIDGHLGAIRPRSPSTANPANPAGRQQERGARGTHPDLFTEKLMRKIPAPLTDQGVRLAHRGIPRLASPEGARRILTRLQTLSAPLGTTIAIEGNVGVVRVRQAPASQP
jgi:hypothetical protein